MRNDRYKNKKNRTKKKIESKSKNQKKGEKIKFSKKHPKIMLILTLFIVLSLFIAVVGSGIVIGMLYGAWGDDFEISEDELIIGSSNSIVLDSEGNKLAELSGDENRKIIKLDQMPLNLKNAYIAIEDERFYTHSGVDFKRTAAAILQYVLHRGSSSFGGSTITQQLVKNVTQDAERTGKEGVLRKVKEWAKAYQIERMISKDQILELYLNIIFVGGNNYGVEVGSEYYFSKSASELDLAECAFLAGINNSPNSYNPYGENNNSEKIKNRSKTVLKKMFELNMIDNTEYTDACAEIDNGLKFQKTQFTGAIYSYHTDATISQVIQDIANQKGISKSLASTYVYSSGLTIYSTQNSTIQSQLDEVMVEDRGKYVKTSASGAFAQSAMVIIDNETGYVVGVEGGLGEKTESRGLNRATQSTRQTGSSIKPLTSLVPGINEGIINAATIYDDASTEFVKKWTPKNYNNFKGLITIRSAVTTSQNIPFVKVVAELTPTKAIEYLEKMGVTSIDKTNDGLAALSIGGFTNGISPLEMAGAYATIANNGVYRTPLFYTKVTDSSNNIVLEAKQETSEVMSKEAAYVVKNLLQSVVQSGTATYCKISRIDVAAKTGTTNSNYDKWLCGFTNYYSAATWYGYDSNEEVTGSTNMAGKIWSAVMNKVHSGKAASNFEKPSGIVSAKICKASGKKATNLCTDTYQEIFIEGTVPGECDAHSNSAKICNESNLLATDYCTDVVTKYFSYTVEKERLGLWKSLNSSVTTVPPDHCTLHIASASTTVQEDNVPVITINGDDSITLNVGDEYVEKGATAKDSVDGDLTNKISTSGTVNTSKVGTYTITYTVKNSKDKTASVKRKIVVKEKDNKQTNKVDNTTSNTTENSSSTDNNTNTSSDKNETVKEEVETDNKDESKSE